MHDHYARVLSRAFPFSISGEPGELRPMAARLLMPEPDFAAGASSFALTVRPSWTLWLSHASRDRLLADGVDRARFVQR